MSNLADAQEIESTNGSDSGSEKAETKPSVNNRSDPRLAEALGIVRVMSRPELKELCVMTEWAAMSTDAEKEILLETLRDKTFWQEVRDMEQKEMSIPEEDGDDKDTDARLMQMFRVFDKDNSGAIDMNEMHQMLLYMGISASVEEVEDLMREHDKDGDMQLNPNEFLEVMKLAQAGALKLQKEHGTGSLSKTAIKRASFRIQRS